MRLDWENDVEVVKQGAAVTIYILPNLFVAMGLVVLAVILGMRMDHRLLALAAILLVSALAALCYRWVMALAKE
jgi:ABC-2 type transport system permease protein